MQITINAPETLEPYADDFKYFVETMGRKLHTNRHKGFTKDLDLNLLLGGLQSEVNELNDALEDEGQFEASIEAVDVANMAFLTMVALHDMDRPSYNKARRKPPKTGGN